LRVAVLADLHACEPWMPRDRIARIVAATNALTPDITLLLGDYVSGIRLATHHPQPAEWAGALAGLQAPLGVHHGRARMTCSAPSRRSPTRPPC